MSKDILAKLNRLAGTKATATEEPVAKKPAVKAANWVDEIEATEDDETVDEEEVGYSVESEDDSDDEDESDDQDGGEVVETTESESVAVDSDELARKVADLVFAKIRDAFNSVP